MCRLFAFRSNTPARVHHALVTETNSLCVQSHEHKDGWGIASWADGDYPTVVHGLGPAHIDPDFERASRLLSSRTVLAHVRLASVGEVVLKNAHPFLYRQWAFAHNGTVRNFAQHRAAIEACIDPDFAALLHGDTDSERLFYIFLTQLRRVVPSLEAPPLPEVARALGRTMDVISRITDVPGADRSSLNLLVSDGQLVAVTRRRRTLFLSDGTARSERPADGSVLPQFLLASERLSGEGVWHEVPEESIIGVDGDIRLHWWTVEGLRGPR